MKPKLPEIENPKISRKELSWLLSMLAYYRDEAQERRPALFNPLNEMCQLVFLEIAKRQEQEKKAQEQIMGAWGVEEISFTWTGTGETRTHFKSSE